MKLDLLAFAAHPDDTELSCSGTMLAHKARGKKVGVVDLTTGQLGTRGSSELRLKEAARAAKILRLDVRDNLGMQDGWFVHDKEHVLAIVRKVREYRPEIVLANAVNDRHPDHGRASRLVSEACFYSGLSKIDTGQDEWRPKAVYHYIQDRQMKPDVIVDISGHMDKKIEAILAFSSQFFDPDSDEPDTPISSKEFLDIIISRSAEHGRSIGVTHGEAFTVDRPIGVLDLTALL